MNGDRPQPCRVCHFSQRADEHFLERIKSVLRAVEEVFEHVRASLIDAVVCFLPHFPEVSSVPLVFRCKFCVDAAFYKTAALGNVFDVPKLFLVSIYLHLPERGLIIAVLSFDT